MKKIVLFLASFVTLSLGAQNIYTVVSNLYIPTGSCVMDASGNLIISDYGNNQVKRFNPSTGTITVIAGTGATGYNGDNILAINASIYGPASVALDASDNIYICDYSNNRVRRVDAITGIITTIAGTGVYGYNGDGIAATSAKICETTGIVVDDSGNVFFSDLGNARVREVRAANGNIYTIAGDGNQGYTGDNIPAITAEINFPIGLAIDTAGDLFIAEKMGCRIRKVNRTTGIISTFAGDGTYGNSGDNGPATSAEFKYAEMICFNSANDLYIADSYDARVRKVKSSNGYIYAFAGDGNSVSSGDGGSALVASLSSPRGVYADGCGNVYITEFSGNGKIREVMSYPVTLSTTDVLCHGACTGVVTASATGVGPFTYSWSGGLGSGATHSSVCAGSYSVTVTDANGCFQNLSVTITQPLALITTTAFVNTPCQQNTGIASVHANDGIFPYTYLWSTGSTNDTITNLTAGSYSVTVTDANGCTNSPTVTIVNNSTAPATSPICMVTVDPASQYNIIVWDKTSFAHVDSFYVYREIATNNYQLLAAIPYDSLSQFVDTVRARYFPNTGNPNAGTYRYKLQASDSCGNRNSMSPYHNTIFITNSNGTFTWSQLYTIEGGPNPVSSYVLLRDNLSNGTWIPVSSVAGTQQTISDPAYATYAATASWRVQTFWSITCTPTMRIDPSSALSLSSSYSNTFSNIMLNAAQTEDLSNVNIFPNVSEGNFHITGVNANMNVEVYSMMGAKVYSAKQEKDQADLDLTSLAKGVYLIHFISDSGMSVKRIVIE